jgi:hypothetical protein
MQEYLIFFPAQGSFIVDVKFAKSNESISERYASSEHLKRLLELMEGSEQPFMSFDERPANITKITIDPVKRKITLHAQLINTLSEVNP